MPTEVGFSEQGFEASDDNLNIATEVIGITHCPVSNNEDIYKLLECYCQIENICRPSDAFSGLDVYVKLLGYLASDGFEI